MSGVDSGEWDPSGRYNELRWRYRLLCLDLLLAVARSTGVPEAVLGRLESRSSDLRQALGATR